MPSSYCECLENCWQEIAAGEPKNWCRDEVHSFAEMTRLIRAIADAMSAAGLSEDDDYSLRLALQEAILNANKHGHQGDWSRPIQVHYFVSPAGVLAEIEDQGPGFEPSQVPDPLAQENLDRPSGRGLLMMRTFMSGVCHNERGNRVCLCKHHPRVPPLDSAEEAQDSSARTSLDLKEEASSRD